MKRIFLIHALALTVLFTAPFAWAETTFITDKIAVELFSSTFQRGVLVTTVNSGAIVEVLESDGDYAKVRTQDGQEGWLHNKYLSTEKPTQVSYLQLMAKHQQLQEEVNKLRNQAPNSAEAEKEKAVLGKMRGDLAQAKKTIASLESQLKQKSSALKQSQQQLASLEKQHQDAVAAQQNAEAPAEDTAESQPPAKEPPPEARAPIMQSSMPVNPPFNLDYPIAIKWLLAVMLLSVLVGSYLGYSWLDKKIARRHGGVRLR
jgi:SH3 domain protein